MDPLVAVFIIVLAIGFAADHIRKSNEEKTDEMKQALCQHKNTETKEIGLYTHEKCKDCGKLEIY